MFPAQHFHEYDDLSELSRNSTKSAGVVLEGGENVSGSWFKQEEPAESFPAQHFHEYDDELSELSMQSINSGVPEKKSWSAEVAINPPRRANNLKGLVEYKILMLIYLCITMY